MGCTRYEAQAWLFLSFHLKLKMSESNFRYHYHSTATSDKDLSYDNPPNPLLPVRAPDATTGTNHLLDL